ncbi:TonB-dependent receptor [Methylophilus sp. TWE2]|uniref:TonB-dependent receptor n=1 Tax=Methylophilus sp. TWE2 TaxID=1662285 RepID=UPI000AC38420|nr:TonB-dependent receptor [Methylophilus sp. TWE2]
MMHKKTIASLLAMMVLPATQVYAEDAMALKKTNKSNANQTDETAASVELDSVVVLGKKEQVTTTDKGLAGSVDVITREELEYEHVTDTLELFSKTPGVVLSRYSQGIVNTEVSIRGFSGDGETPNAKVLVDGIPSNLFSGLSELDYLFPTNIQSAQVFKGTSDATTGLFATAGSYKVETRKDAGKQLQFGYGSFQTREMQGYYGEKQGDLTQNYAIGYRKGNGFRDHTENEKIALSGRWQLDFDQSTLALSAKYGKYNSPEAPGYMPKAQTRSNRTGVAPNALNDSGEKEFKHLSLHYDYFFNNNVDLSLKTYWQNFDRERNVRFIGSPGVENRQDNQTSTGLIARLNWKINSQWAFETGYDIEHQKVDQFNQRVNAVGVNVIRLSSDFDFTAQGIYAKVENTPVDWLRWNFALRADRLDAKANDPIIIGTNGNPTRMIPTDLYSDSSIVQPKFNVFANLTEQHTLFANAGRSFQTPTSFNLNQFNSAAGPNFGTRTDIKVAINDGWELGLKSSWIPDLNTRVSYWQQKAKNEFITIDTIRQPLGETLRQGLDASFDYKLNDAFSFWGNISRVYAKIEEPNAQNPEFKGNNIRSIPSYTASLGMQFVPNADWIARVHVDSQGDYYINESNQGGKYGGYTLTHANIDYKTSWGRLSLLANNIFDRYYEYVFDFNSNGSAGGVNFAPGAGRNFMLTATVDFK